MEVFAAEHRFAIIGTAEAIETQLFHFDISVFVRPEGNFL